jgi:hypothetical protein
MRCIAILLASSLVLAQTPGPGKPGVTDPIKDPRQIPGHENPGPVPRPEPQPVKPALDTTKASDKSEKSEKKAKKKADKSGKSQKVSPSKQ